MEQAEYSLKKSLEKRLKKIESQLEKVRGASPLSHGWQTQKLAKAQRKWDALAQEKRELISKLSKVCDGDCSICKDSTSCNYFKSSDDDFSDMFYGDTLSQ